ncbi:MAG: PPOX class F420-dependent oxidoreductase [Chloroflexi bacterium]|nr:PPOX class F420-dependent oxidoreductase [Chloroflexota bacterium]
MSIQVPEAAKDLLERPIVVTLVTLMPDYQPQANPVWFEWDGEYIWINTARGRAKDKNMTARPKVTVLSTDPDDPYRYLEVRGIVAEVTEKGAFDHINHLSERYTGNPDFFGSDHKRRATEVRVIYKIRPTKISYHD